MEQSGWCEYLSWDSEFFDRRIARLHSLRLTADLVREAEAWCDTHRIDCLYFLADVDDPVTAELAHRHGFQPVDMRVTLSRPVESYDHDVATPPPDQVRPARLQDLDHLRTIAQHAYGATRFYFDRRFPRPKCAELYATWIEHSVRNNPEQVLVADVDNTPVGFIVCELGDAHVGRIALLGVASEAQGHRHGQALVERALSWFVLQHVSLVRVVTQARNVPAQRLYQGCGFRTEGVQLWHHRWFHRSHQTETRKSRVKGQESNPSAQ